MLHLPTPSTEPLHDFSHIIVGRLNIATRATRAHAKAHAQRIGWAPHAVLHAYNRFGDFWVVAEHRPDEQRYLVATEDGRTLVIPVRNHNNK